MFSVIRSRSVTLYIKCWVKEEVGGGSGIFAPGLLSHDSCLVALSFSSQQQHYGSQLSRLWNLRTINAC